MATEGRRWALDFGRHIRFQLGITDAGAIEKANVTLSVALRFYEGV